MPDLSFVMDGSSNDKDAQSSVSQGIEFYYYRFSHT